MHRVYEAELFYCVNAVHEFTLRKGIAAGQKLLKPDALNLLHETPAWNEARRLAKG